jgi:glycosyltransferase involved in cell wall biosynthesis
MRVLFVSPFLPYPGVPHAGGKLIHHFLSVLVRSHSVVLLSRIFPGEEGHLRHLSGMLERVETVPAEGPIRAGSLVSLIRTVASYRKLCRRARILLLSERFDLCQVEYTETGVFFPGNLGAPAILSCHDVIAKPAYRRFAGSRGIGRLSTWVGWRVALAAERRAVGKFRRIFTLSDEDLEWAGRLYPEGGFRTLRYPAGIGYRGISRCPRDRRVLFVGALNRPQNRDGMRYFLREVWPIVRLNFPDAEFHIVGEGMDENLRKEVAAAPGVKPAGGVPEVEPYYVSAAVFVAPILTGGGVIVKVLDALAAGVPTVTTRYGNEGIRANDGKEILIADTAKDFAGAVIFLLGDVAARDAMGKAGRRFVNTNFSEEAFSDTVDAVYREVASATGAR